ncbi:MAG: DUF4838 domain-containing protein, partial [Clostridia bacterium]|nr:DUF4838 domain-containing protein [Clostridia bacterium]
DREELGDDGLVIKTKDQKLFLVGGEKRGTLYAVYEFLESYLGCRFYTRDIEKVPEQKTLSVSHIEEDKQIPVYSFRVTSSYALREDDIAAKRKLNGRLKYAEEYGSDQLWVLSGIHSFQHLVPEKEYYAEHPEYYSCKGGQPCLTNPEVLEIAIENTRKYLEAKKDDPRYTIMPVAQNDNVEYCKCENCKALYDAEESYGAATLQFVNSVATALKDEFPDITFMTLAYHYSRNLPKTIRPAENVAVILCSIEECFSHPIGTHDDWLNTHDVYVKNTFEKDFEDWAAVTDNLYIWDYTINYSTKSASHPNFNVLLKNEQFFADHNVLGVYEENSTSIGAYPDFNELRSYLISKILWNPYMSDEEYQYHINDFLENVYGKGWTYIREYFDFIHEIGGENCFGIWDSLTDRFGIEKITNVNNMSAYPEELTIEMLQNYEDVDWTKYWNFFADLEKTSLIDEGYRLFGLAYDMAETEEQKTAIEMAALQVYVNDSIHRSISAEFGNGSINQIIINFFREDSHGLSTQEKNALRKKVVDYAGDQMDAKYIEFNRTVYELYLKHGLIDKDQEIDLRNIPSQW